MNRLLHRATALLLGLLFLQVILVGSGFTCIGTTEMQMTDSPEMLDMPEHQSHSAERHRSSSESHERGSDGCSLPWAPAGCATMVPCAPHALTSHVQTMAAVPGASHTIVARETGTPPSVTIALDTPPPRA